MIQNLEVLKRQLIRIENINTWKVKIPKLHPDSDRYIKLWSLYTKYCIEGLWGFDSGGWRYMPGTLFFYSNFFSILDVDEEQKVRRYIRPFVRDIDWMLHYAYLEAQGFSGWSEDDEYTSDYRVFDFKSISEVGKLTHLVSSKGTLKTFMHPRDNIKRLAEKPLGVPLYANPAKNIQVFGSRGGGKSFTFSGIIGQHVSFDGLKYFIQDDFDNPPSIEVCVGSGNTDKSSEFCTKVVEGLKAFGTDNNLGVWGRADRGDDDYTPNPFYRDWEGSVNVGNKKNPYRYEYSAKIGSRWIHGLGTKTKLIHVNYSDKKQGGEAAAAGGRYIMTLYEEVGLMSNLIDAWFSNDATVKDPKGNQFGVQVAIGTSGNINLVQQSKKMFHNPSDYGCLEYDDIWENSGKIGFFLPCYLTNQKYKDENGNTDVEKALEHYALARVEAAKSADPDALRYEKMNYPIVPSDMWISGKGHYFPVMELMDREKELIKFGKYKTMGDDVKLLWDSNQQYGVRSEPDMDCEPFYEFPYSSSMNKTDGSIKIYQRPQLVHGEIPNDMYFFVLDPYIADDVELGGSLGALYGFVNPKYSALHNGGTMVCSYIGKHPNGRDGFYENVEKIIAYYGNNPRSLWYESNAGDSVRGYFVKKNKAILLALTPTRESGNSAYEKRVASYGIRVNAENKLEFIGDTSDYLLQKTIYDGKELRVVETLPDIFLIRQLIAFEIKKHKNFDAVSAFILAPFVMKELQHIQLYELDKKSRHNPASVLSMNPNVFKTDDTMRRLQKFKQKYAEQNEDN